MKKLIAAVMIALSFSAVAADQYVVEIEHNDEMFIINGERYEARTYCMSLEEDDSVIFLEGSPYGNCSTATVYDVNSRNTCDLWCE
ncbi:MAG: hypothetical protein ACRCUJ_02910 [Phocaeicola sp.]